MYTLTNSSAAEMKLFSAILKHMLPLLRNYENTATAKDGK